MPHTFEFIRMCCHFYVDGKRHRDMIKTGVLELVEELVGCQQKEHMRCKTYI